MDKTDGVYKCESMTSLFGFDVHYFFPFQIINKENGGGGGGGGEKGQAVGEPALDAI